LIPPKPPYHSQQSTQLDTYSQTKYWEIDLDIDPSQPLRPITLETSAESTKTGKLVTVNKKAQHCTSRVRQGQQRCGPPYRDHTGHCITCRHLCEALHCCSVASKATVVQNKECDTCSSTHSPPIHSNQPNLSGPACKATSVSSSRSDSTSEETNDMDLKQWEENVSIPFTVHSMASDFSVEQHHVARGINLQMDNAAAFLRHSMVPDLCLDGTTGVSTGGPRYCDSNMLHQ